MRCFGSLVKAVREINNYSDIRECVEECIKEKCDFSLAFDYCVDEVAVDSLVCLGGNPSKTEGVFEKFENIAAWQACLNVRRRLYHGADLKKEDLEKAKEMGDFLSRANLFSHRTTPPPARKKYYFDVDVEKLDFWKRFKPSVYTDVSTQEHSVEGGGDSQWISMRNGVELYTRPSVHVVKGKKTLRTLYMTKYLSIDEWEQAEKAFGRYYRRTVLITLGCRRNAKNGTWPTKPKKKSKSEAVSKSVSTVSTVSTRELRYMVYSLGLIDFALVKLMVEFLVEDL